MACPQLGNAIIITLWLVINFVHYIIFFIILATIHTRICLAEYILMYKHCMQANHDPAYSRPVVCTRIWDPASVWRFMVRSAPTQLLLAVGLHAVDSKQ